MKQTDHLCGGNVILDFGNLFQGFTSLSSLHHSFDLLTPVPQTQEPVFDGDDTAAGLGRQSSERVQVRFE